MKSIIISAFIITSSASVLSAQTLIADTGKSTLKWHGKKVTGEHEGLIQLSKGYMEVKEDRITSGKFIIDMNSITNTDLTDPAWNKKLVDHLKSDDFFGVAKYPEAIIEVKKSTKFVNNEATVDANLTVKGITHPISFTVTKDDMAYHAEVVVDRSKYNVRYGSGSFFDNLGNNLIYDNFTIKVKVMMKMDEDEVS
jgi:polyisoprenoid-binding protein YceI